MTKYKTLVYDSIGEMSRMYFSKAIGKTASEIDVDSKIRGRQHYPGTTERMNMFLRSAEDLRSLGVEQVFIGHEQIDRIYAKGSSQDSEPVAVRGIPDLPGQAFPEEMLRKCDCIFRMRLANGKPFWMAQPELLNPLVPDTSWYAGARFDTGKFQTFPYLPPSYAQIKSEAERLKIHNWLPPYIWLIYGVSKIGKTRLVTESFPKPMALFDFDRGSQVLGPPDYIKSLGITVFQYKVEDKSALEKFTIDFKACFA